MEMVERNIDKPWNWHSLSTHPNLTMVFIGRHPDKPWSWNKIAETLNITIDFIDNYLSCWFTEISRNPNITIDFIERYIDKPWNWFCISRKQNLTSEVIKRHPDKPWNWDVLSGNPNITLEIIEQHINKPWNWALLYATHNGKISIEIINKYTNNKWNDFAIPKHAKTLEIINAYELHHTGLDWNWDWEFISKYETFAKSKILFYEKWYRKYMAVFRIQQYYNLAIDNPKYKLCRDRFYRKWEEE